MDIIVEFVLECFVYGFVGFCDMTILDKQKEKQSGPILKGIIYFIWLVLSGLITWVAAFFLTNLIRDFKGIAFFIFLIVLGICIFMLIRLWRYSRALFFQRANS